jgi:hypothetical protein
MGGDSIDDVVHEIGTLRNLDLDSLKLRWRAVFGRSAPSHLPKNLVMRLLAYRLQADVLGDLSRSTVQLLSELTRREASHGEGVTASVPVSARGQLKPGTLLVREHAGQSHHVMVVEDGFSWSGKTYGSLTKVAHAITGTKWNGPRFFGLRERTHESAQ